MNSSINSRALFQTALLQSLVLGHYEGFLEVKELKGQGDFGIGTFDSLDGELVMCHGKVYQVNGRGEVKEAADDWKVPFADVFFFETDRILSLKDISSLDELRERADDFIKRWGPNYFYGIRIHGTFDKVYARSEKAQKKPYQRLDEVMKKDQVEFHFAHTEGTLIGLYCPSFMGGLNMPGYHFHYLSDDRKEGGHVFDLSLAEGKAEFCLLSDFKLKLPRSSSFGKIDFTENLDEAVKKVEG
ncbi:acetolactate decarboxylase [uncultured Dialister sp.]|uniref:acetolactate decarboxylase n=1 Tax=uncultured Dialister sp. TaxID=278064 RepID=UPI0026344C0B|nr:acetolactate decarboxylase [uncultured Dialister sp.]